MVTEPCVAGYSRGSGGSPAAAVGLLRLRTGGLPWGGCGWGCGRRSGGGGGLAVAGQLRIQRLAVLQLQLRHQLLTEVGDAPQHGRHAAALALVQQLEIVGAHCRVGAGEGVQLAGQHVHLTREGHHEGSGAMVVDLRGRAHLFDPPVG